MDLIGEYTKRATNHSELLSGLREVNQMIQKAARLRLGQAKTRVVTACRTAVKQNNIEHLLNIIVTGKDK
jgi:Bardet-Biedl syndrome 2 protein